MAPLIWEPGPGTHLLFGDNGAGKTSILEAIYVLATTRSFRTHQINDCRRHGAEGFDLLGEVEGPARIRLAVGWNEAASTRYRQVNGREGSLAEHLTALPVVAWTAADADLLTGAPRARRRFLDRGVLGLKPAAIDVVARYRRALAQKRLLLGYGPRGTGEGTGAASAGGGTDALEAWNGVLATAAAELIQLRQAYFDRLREAFEGALEASRLAFPSIELRYRPSPSEGLEDGAAVEAALTRVMRREIRQERPVLGPHLDELEVSWNDHELKRVASAGERRALTMLLTVAHGQVLAAAGRDPVYLFDDADIELSETTLTAVWRAMGKVRQLFASSNRPGIWEGFETGRAWHLEEGSIGAFREL